MGGWGGGRKVTLCNEQREGDVFFDCLVVWLWNIWVVSGGKDAKSFNHISR